MENRFQEAFSKLPSVDLEHQIHLNRYIKFISSRLERKFEYKKGLCKHHVHPVSFGANKGFKEKWNIIVLTEREHFIAHLILYKCYGGKMTRAFFMMNNGKNILSGNYSNLNSKQYEKLRKEYTEKISGKGNPMYGKEMKEINKKLRKILWTGKNNPMYNSKRYKNKNPFYGEHHTEETKIKLKKIDKTKIMKKVILLNTKKIFNSITEASKITNISASSIIGCCSHNPKITCTHYGYENYYWLYIEEYDPNFDYSYLLDSKKIICIEKNEIFNSVKECSLKMNISETYLSLCCNNKVDSAKGYHFMKYNAYKGKND